MFDKGDCSDAVSEIKDPKKNQRLIAVEGLSIEYLNGDGDVLRVVNEVGFQLESGKRLALVGPSGCGKTSILKALAGLLVPASGRITFGDLAPPEARAQRIFGLVPQHDALLKWRTTSGNVALPLQIAGVNKKTAMKRVEYLLELFGLLPFADYFPSQLSGGMRSRASIARALALEPDVLLLDECFANLDVMTRERLYKELSPMWSRLATTLIFITHSVPEAIYLADEIVVLTARPGRVIEKLTIDADQPRPDEFMNGAVFHKAAAKIRSLLGL